MQDDEQEDNKSDEMRKKKQKKKKKDKKRSAGSDTDGKWEESNSASYRQSPDRDHLESSWNGSRSITDLGDYQKQGRAESEDEEEMDRGRCKNYDSNPFQVIKSFGKKKWKNSRNQFFKTIKIWPLFSPGGSELESSEY